MTQNSASVSDAEITDPQLLIAAGRKAGESGDWKLAADFYLRASQQTNDKGHAALYVRALLRIGDVEAALGFCRSAPGLQTPGAAGLKAVLEFSALVSARQLKKALDLLNLCSPGALPVPLLERFVTQLLRGNLDFEVATIRRHLDASNDPLSAFYFDAQIAEKEDRLSEALELYQRVASSGSGQRTANARIQSAHILAALGDAAGALAVWRQILDADPKNIPVRISYLQFLAEDGTLPDAAEEDKLRSEALDLFEEIDAESGPKAGSSRVQVARLLTAVRAHEAAKAAWRKVLDANPNNAEAQKSYLLSIKDDGTSIEDQLEHADAAIRAVSKDLGLLRTKGTLLEKMGRCDEAASHYLETIRAVGGPAELWSKTAALLVEVGRPEDAAVLASRAKEHFPAGTPEGQVEIAEIFLSARNIPEARPFIERALALHPGFPPALWLNAEIEVGQGRTISAVAEFSKLLSCGSSEFESRARVQIARLHGRLGDRSATEKAWARVRQNDPDNQEALRFFLDEAVRQGETARARELLAGIRHKLSKSQANLLEAKIMGDVPSAIAFLKEAVARDPADFDQWLALASTQIRQRDLDGAEDTIRQCRDQAPDVVEVHKLQLQLLELAGAPLETQLAEAEVALKLIPGDLDLLRTVGRLLTRMGRHADAVRHYLDAVKITSAPGDLWRKAAELLVEESRFEEAAALAADAKAHLGTASAEALADTAAVYFAARRVDEASALVEAAFRIEPDFGPALRLAVDLEMSQGRDWNAARHIKKLDQQEPAKRRSVSANAMARIMSAQNTPLRPGPKEAPHNLFPERLFHNLAASKRPDTETPRAGILHVGSSLAAGGAERQLSYALDALKRTGNPDRQPWVVMRNLDPNKGNDFYLDDVKANGADLTVIQDLVSSGELRRILDSRPDLAPTVRSFAAMPMELGEVAIPLLAYFTVTKPKIVHLWQDSICISGGMAAMAAGVPAIIQSLRSTTPVEVHRSRRFLREGYLASAAYSGSVTLINNSAAGARDYEDWLGLTPGAVRVIYNGYDFDRISRRATTLSREAVRAELGVPEDALVIGSAMRFAREKRPDLWIETVAKAMERNDRIYGLMVGDGPRWQRLFETVRDRGLQDRLKLVGRKSPIEPWISAMDLFFLSSAREGLPNVLIEAQSLGVPVLTTNAGGSSETLPPDDTGWLLPEASSDIWAEKLLDVMSDPEHLRTAGQRAKSSVHSRFGLEKASAELMQLYNDIEESAYSQSSQ